MKRRTFNKLVTAGAASAMAAGTLSCSSIAKASVAKKPALMHVGCQRGDVTKEELEFKARHGVYHIDGRSPKLIEGVGWDLQDAKRRSEMAAEYGISIDAYHLPLTSAGIDRVSVPHIMLGKSPERDREIEMTQQMISVAGRTGVRTLLYNATILPIFRTERTPGRGGVTYSSLDLSKATARSKELTRAGAVNNEAMA